MRTGLFCLLFVALVTPTQAQEQLRCATRGIEDYINKQLDERFGQKLTAEQKLEMIGRGMDYQVKATWKSASTVSQDANGLLCSALVTLFRPDTGETFDVTVQYTMQHHREGGIFVKFNSATK